MHRGHELAGTHYSVAREKMHSELPANNPNGAGWATLKRFVRPSTPEERCELCSIRLGHDHRHLLELSAGRVICACDACALRFHDVIESRFKLIPRDVRFLNEFRLTDQEWDSLALPINLAFFYYSTREAKMKATYPSPAGATESLLPLDAWQNLAAKNPPLAHLAPDVEALLVNRVNPHREYYVAPIDLCFELVGLIRVHWKGLSGGDMVWKEITNFFLRLKKQASSEDSL